MVNHSSRFGQRETLRPARILRILSITGLLLASGGIVAGECVQIDLEDAIRLPDGSLHDAGSLTLCHSIRYSPVSSLHETYVNGNPLGMLRSRTRTSEIAGEAPAVVYFTRSLDGYLDLYGYVVPGREASTTFLFEARQTRRAARARRTRDPETSPSKMQPDLVAVAAPSP